MSKSGEIRDLRCYRVLLVDDSDSYRTALAYALARDKSIEIIGEAADGKTAMEMIARLHPDIVLMDVIMPRMDGIETARAVLHNSSAPIILMSVMARYPEHVQALDKLPAGVVDFTDKPVLVGAAGQANIAALIRRLKAAVHNQARSNDGAQGQQKLAPPSHCRIIAIAASTGGLDACRQVLSHLRPNFPPVVIAQHVDPEFAERFARLLENTVRQPVTAVSAKTLLLPGHLYVAAHYHHIECRQGALHSRLVQPGELAPSANHLFFSVGHWYGENAVGVILTGMGQDGALGLRAMREAGGWTIAQDDQSALVNGMPQAAVDAGACREVLPLERIADRLANLRFDPG